ncbi:MAG: AAA family ATPase [Clostridia bacterium]|nr:AAA family ATPase [Clostridia bacterium]
MEARKLPLGIENFEEIRTQGFYYVDKTLLIRDLLNGWGKVNLFTRPRRFGKTLNMSMLKSFFEIGGDRSLFDGLAIAEEKALCDAYMGKYPVVFVSLKGVDGLGFADACDMLSEAIYAEAIRHQSLMNSDRLTDYEKKPLQLLLEKKSELSDIKGSLQLFSRLLYKHYGKKAILLIDEYDVPLDKAYNNGYYEEMIDLIRSMFGAALKTNDSLYFAVLTGCLRISKESIFTGLNNLKVHSITDAQFDEFFGFTQQEVETLLNAYSLQSHAGEVKEWYDGYRFGKQDVYCPWDVINYCYDLQGDRKKKPRAYWLNASGNDIVRRLIDKADDGTSQMEIERLIDGRSIYKTLNEGLTHNEIDADINNVWSLLFMTGYLTMKGDPEDDVYELVIPNREVRKIYTEKVLAWFRDKARTETNRLTDLYRAFEEGDAHKVKEFLDFQLLYTVSFHDAHESFYHGFLLALLNTCGDWFVTSNREAGKGRNDISVERKDRKRGFVVEVKDVKKVSELDKYCNEAIRQIEEKDYAAPLRRYRIKDIWIYGIAFCDKECRVVAKHLD